MMTMNKVIEQIDRLKPNVYTDEDKYRWINTLEGLVCREVLQRDEPSYNLPDDADSPLLVEHPFDDLYGLYVASMIDFHNREYDNYNNTALMFQQRYDQYKVWYIQTHAPTKVRKFKNVMG
jgi:hypothetical protein